MMQVDFIEEAKIGIPKKRVIKLVDFVLTKKGGKKPLALSVISVSSAKMRKLNKQWRNKDKATDVLSFPASDAIGNEDGEKFIGDIFLCPMYIKAAAKELGVTYHEQVMRVLAHGVLHLLGYDHERRDDKGKMLRLQERLLKDFRASTV